LQFVRSDDGEPGSIACLSGADAGTILLGSTRGFTSFTNGKDEVSMCNMLRVLLSGILASFATTVQAADISGNLEVQKVTDNVFTLVGLPGDRTPENLSNNATYGVVITPEGVVLINSGGTFQGAQRIHKSIRSITKMPVKVVINTNSQDHRWLGNDYFRRHGARIIAQEEIAAIDQSDFDYLENYDLLSGRNAQQVYQELEWE